MQDAVATVQFKQVAVHGAAQGLVDDLSLVERIAGVWTNVVQQVDLTLVLQKQEIIPLNAEYTAIAFVQLSFSFQWVKVQGRGLWW